jgi:hypothetical protein
MKNQHKKIKAPRIEMKNKFCIKFSRFCEKSYVHIVKVQVNFLAIWSAYYQSSGGVGEGQRIKIKPNVRVTQYFPYRDI